MEKDSGQKAADSMRLSDDERKGKVNEYIDFRVEGENKTNAAARVGIARETLYRWALKLGFRDNSVIKEDLQGLKRNKYTPRRPRENFELTAPEPTAPKRQPQLVTIPIHDYAEPKKNNVIVLMGDPESINAILPTVFNLSSGSAA